MDEIKKEAMKICEGVFDSMNELDTIDWYFIDNRQWKLGFRIDKDAPNKYSVRISGDGIHYSKTLKGLRPHILKKIEQILGIKRMEIEVAMKNKTCGECKHLNRELAFCRACGAKWISIKDATNCKYFEQIQPPTLFDRITGSPETLAQELVTLDCDGWWAYIGIGKRESYLTREEAIAATVARLKEVAE